MQKKMTHSFKRLRQHNDRHWNSYLKKPKEFFPLDIPSEPAGKLTIHEDRFILRLTTLEVNNFGLIIPKGLFDFKLHKTKKEKDITERTTYSIEDSEIDFKCLNPQHLKA